MNAKVIDTIEYPTEIIEEGWCRVNVEEWGGTRFCRVTWPERAIEEETLIRLEMKGLSLWNMRTA